MLQIDDNVKINAWYCEMNEHTGKIIELLTDDNFTYLVELDNYRIWPFEENELIKIDN